MWKLWHKLFGWDYVFAIDCGNPHNVRVKHHLNNQAYFVIVSKVGWIDKQGNFDGCYNLTEVIPLTWEIKEPTEAN